MRTSYKQGSIFFHKNFKFKDGQIGKKFLILLNYSADEKEYIFLKTTSNPKNK